MQLLIARYCLGTRLSGLALYLHTATSHPALKVVVEITLLALPTADAVVFNQAQLRRILSKHLGLAGDISGKWTHTVVAVPLVPSRRRHLLKDTKPLGCMPDAGE